MMLKPFNVLFCCGVLLSLSSCSLFEVKDSGPSRPVDVSHVKDAVPKVEPRSPYGNPSRYEQDGITYHVLDSAQNYSETGVASWYGTKFHRQRTSSGEPYDMYAMTAAHKTLPLPSYVRVTNLDNGRKVVVKVNDRGPFKEGRIIDLSYAAAVKLGIQQQGTGRVKVDAIVPEGSHSVVGPIAVPDGKIMYVQVGAFSDKSKANKLVLAISQQVPWPVSLSPIKVRQTVLHRLRIGPIDTTEQANNLVKTLTMPELGTPKVIFE